MELSNLAEELIESAAFGWTKTPNGYRSKDGKVSMFKRDGMWWLEFPGADHIEKLGKKASFDTAERRLMQLKKELKL